MHFACTQENLTQGLTLISHTVNKNINLPVLGNVLLKTESGSLKLSTTNLELIVNCVVRGKVEREGEYSVPAKLFLDYVSLLPSGKVELLLQEEGLEVRSGEQETMFRGLAANEFPLLPKPTEVSVYEINAQDLRRAISQVVFAVSTSEARPELIGVACFFSEETITCVATDSYRLAERALLGVTGSREEGRYTLPMKTCVEIARILGAYKDELGTPGKVNLSFTENQMRMTYGSVEIISRLIAESFPDYKQLLPQVWKTEVIVSRTELQKAVRTASLFSRQGLFDVTLTFDPTRGSCTIQSADQGTGKTKSTIPCTVIGEPNTAVLNHRYVSEGLAAMNSEMIRMKQVDAINILLFVPEGSQEKYQYAVMPIRQ